MIFFCRTKPIIQFVVIMLADEALRFVYENLIAT